ncbi:MAG: helix-turn-helix transcriptional regulator [Ruminococcaceae bacterium]|nr:helix-turn-helix transcriptional regulator [Oscillospiraceae bacterium]
MENRSNYEKKRKILEDNIIRIMREKNLTARALSMRIEENERCITRMLSGKIDPSLNTLFDIVEVLKVEPPELFTKKES